MVAKPITALQTIDMSVITYDVTDAAIAEMRQKYTGLEIVDTASYETVRLGIAEIREMEGQRERHNTTARHTSGASRVVCLLDKARVNHADKRKDSGL